MIVTFLVDEKILNKKLKFAITIILTSVLVVGYLYETLFEDISSERNALIIDFQQGKTLVCNGVDVNFTNFNFSYPTSSFIAKKEAPAELKKLMFDLKRCKPK